MYLKVTSFCFFLVFSSYTQAYSDDVDNTILFSVNNGLTEAALRMIHSEDDRTKYELDRLNDFCSRAVERGNYPKYAPKKVCDFISRNSNNMNFSPLSDKTIRNKLVGKWASIQKNKRHEYRYLRDGRYIWKSYNEPLFTAIGRPNTEKATSISSGFWKVKNGKLFTWSEGTVENDDIVWHIDNKYLVVKLPWAYKRID